MLIAVIVVLAMIGLVTGGFIVYGVYLGVALLVRFSAQAYRQVMTPEAGLYGDGRGFSVRASTAGHLAKATPALHCWDAKHCPADVREGCPAHKNPELPCWLARVRANQFNKIEPDCLGCTLFSLPQSIEPETGRP